MELFPSEYQHLELSRYEKVFIRHALSCTDGFHMLLLKVNPAVLPGESLHIAAGPEGVVLCKFLPVDAPALFPAFLRAYMTGVYASTAQIAGDKLAGNRCLVGRDGNLRVPYTFCCVFPSLKRAEIDEAALTGEARRFAAQHCMFAETFSRLRGNFWPVVSGFLAYPERPVSSDRMELGEGNINAVLQRLAPEYTTVRLTAPPPAPAAAPGAGEELLVVTSDDVAVRAFRLEEEQVNLVNRMTKGDQLILACAGSGKSVLLIAKCFKAARMNPDKRFLITCYNRNLQSLYTWLIERAGLQERNVDCYTFDGLCRRLLAKNNLRLPGGSGAIEARRDAVAAALSGGSIPDRYYGIFIDEVQMFETAWYQLCFNLLENRDAQDHIFVICGDRTQEIKRRQKHGRAPWNAGGGYPVYRGGNKSIRIEKNFRNCVEINAFINRFADQARALLMRYAPSEGFDPDLFLRGQAFRRGNPVRIQTVTGGALAEARAAAASVRAIHDQAGVPYDEIAVLMYNRKYQAMRYYLESALRRELAAQSVPYHMLYGTEEAWGARYGEGGVSLITFDSVLGLDFQAVVVCGVKPLGAYDRTKKLKPEDQLTEEQAEQLKENISYLYVACTRARDHLHIILSEQAGQSLYAKLILDSREDADEDRAHTI